MNVANCKQGLSFLPIVFLPSVAASDPDSHPKGSLKNTSLLQFCGEGGMTSVKCGFCTSSCPSQGTKGQETAEAVSHKALGGQICFVTICEAFDSSLFACYGCDA